jgi:hypothetical protein
MRLASEQRSRGRSFIWGDASVRALMMHDKNPYGGTVGLVQKQEQKTGNGSPALERATALGRISFLR